MVNRPTSSDSSRQPSPPEVLSAHWEAVLRYAEICTVTSADGAQLATEACDQALGKASALRSSHVPPAAWLPQLLGAVRATRAAWLARGDGHRLHPDLRFRLAARAALPATERPRRPLAVQAFQRMAEPDRSLLWDVEVESASVEAVARMLGGDASYAEAEVARVRQAFRQRCLRAHVGAIRDEACRGYSRLLEVSTRDPGSPSCPDLEQHLVLCDDCSEAAACLALHRGGIPGALADGLLGWGGVAYLERRHEAPGGAYGGRRAQRLSDRRAAPGQAGRATVAAVGTLFVPAALVAFLLVPSDPSSTADAGGAKAPTVAGGPEWPDDEAWERVGKSSPSGSPDPSRPAGRPSHTGMDKTLRERPRPTRPTRTADAEKTAGERSRPARPSRPAQRPKPSPTAAGPACKARYQLVHQWGGGFRADVEITYNRPLHGWQLTWSFSGGQHIKQMWSGNYQQYGPRVTVNPVDYNTHVAAGQSFTVGFLADAPYQGYNPSPGDIVLNGSRCTG